jgi:hypothetical protein
MTHQELMQYANTFFMAAKLFPNEIEGHIRRELHAVTGTMTREAALRIQAYRNVLKAQKANSMAAIADVEVAP